MDARQRVIQRAAELFPVVGIRNVTMDSLASDLGMSKRTIYELFGQKDDLVIETFRYLISQENQELLEIIQRSTHMVDALFRIIRRKIESRQKVSPLFIEDLTRYFARIQEMFFTEYDNLSRYSASFVLFQKGIQEGIFRPDIDLVIVDNFLHEMMNIVHTGIRMKAFQLTNADVLRNIFIPYFRGLATSKGQQLIDEFFENFLSNNSDTYEII